MKKLSTEYRIKLKKIFSIIISWSFISIIIACYDHLVLYSLYASGPAANYSFDKSLLLHLGSGVIGSILGSVYLVFYVNEKYRDKPYWQSIAAAIAGVFIIVLIVTIILGVATAGLLLGTSISNPTAAQGFRSFVLNAAHLKNALVWGIVVILTQFTFQ